MRLLGGSTATKTNMNALRKFLVGVLGIAVAITVSILVTMKGWGLEPKSWGWIIGVSFFGHLFAQIIIEVAKSDKDD